jgi:cell division protein FtsB
VFGESTAITWIVVGLLAILCLLIVRPVAMSLLSWHRTAGLLAERRDEVANLEARNDELKAEYEYYQTEGFLAERAREYGLVLPGETPYVVRELVHPESVERYTAAHLQAVAAE